MHIGFDISQTGSGKAGCGYFAHAMIQAMTALAPQHRYSLYPSFGDFFFDAKMPLLAPYGGDQIKYGPRHLTAASAAQFWNQPELETALGQPDIVQSNNFWIPSGIASSRLVYTLYDIGFAENPEWTTEANRVGCFEGVFRAAVEADWVIAISEHSRAHYLKLFPHFPADRVRVVYPCSRFTDPAETGTRPAAVAEAFTNGFWLSVGTIEPRKNQIMLVQAYADYLAAGGPPMPLVLAGGKGWLMDDFQSRIDRLGLSSQVILTGYVSDEELIWLYRNCFANLYPSVFEGFGLPVLEGMQFGAPTVSSNATSMPEVTGDAALLLPPGDLALWTQSMLDLAATPGMREQLSRAALARARQFDWQRSARGVLEIYQEAVALPKRSRPSQVGP